MKFVLNSILNCSYISITFLIIIASYFGLAKNYAYLDSFNLSEYLLSALMATYLFFIILVFPLLLRFAFRKLLEKIFKIDLENWELTIFILVIRSCQ
jgi:hypothetical protein